MEPGPALEAQFSGLNGLAFEALPFILFAAQALHSSITSLVFERGHAERPRVRNTFLQPRPLAL